MPIPLAETAVAASALLSLVFGGGLFKLYIQHVKDLAVQKHKLDNLEKERAEDKKILTQHETDLRLMNQSLEYLQKALEPLKELPTLVTGFAVQTAQITGIKDSLALLAQHTALKAD